MKTYGGSRGTTPPFLTSVIDGGEYLASRPSHFTRRDPLNKRLGGFQSQSGCCEEKNLLPLTGIEPWPSIPHPVATAKIYKHVKELSLRYVTFIGNV
jgi:hypothetical protein